VVWTLPDLSFVERLPAAWRRAVASQPSHSERAEGAGTAAGSGPVGAGRKGTAAGGGQENGKGTSGTPAGTGEGAVMPAVQEVAISFSSNVDKATVVVGGVAACITPCRVTRKVGESAEVRVEKEGFAAYARTLTWERAVGVHAVLSEVLSKTDGLKDGSTTATDDGLK
jgi:hypothetical protein